MISPDLENSLSTQLGQMRDNGVFKDERVLLGPQSTRVCVSGDRPVLNLCANNYLGLANHPGIVAAAHAGLDEWGFGLASVRFICGTQKNHKDLERELSDFLGMEDTILYSSCFDANGGLFETVLGPDDAVISDELNHASIIDGIRLCKARRFRYRNNDMAALESSLREAGDAGRRLIATDGVFSMDGTIANLPAICELAEKYQALVMVDDSHATGFIGAHGRGTPEFHNVTDRIDILTGTFGKALGGGSGGYVSSRCGIIELLRQKSRPYLFSNSLLPSVVSATRHALSLVRASGDLRRKLTENTAFFRTAMEQAGFTVVPGQHPIVPIMFGDALISRGMADALLEQGVYVISFSHPVVPHGQARIRTQISAAHEREDLEFAVRAFQEAAQSLHPQAKS